VIPVQLKLTKLKLEVLSAQKRKIQTQINLQLTGKISLKFDFSSVCFYNTVLQFILLHFNRQGITVYYRFYAKFITTTIIILFYLLFLLFMLYCYVFNCEKNFLV